MSSLDDEQLMIEMEATEKCQRKQDKIFYQESILKECKELLIQIGEMNNLCVLC